MEQLISLRDFTFLLYDVLDAESLCASDTFSMHGRDVFDAILETAKKLAEEKFETHAGPLDREPPRLENGRVLMMPEVKEATDAFAANGFSAGPFPEVYGGMGLPLTISNTYNLFINAANISTSSYLGLTMAAAHLLLATGDEQLKSRFLPHMVSGRFFGTMCLSEPHAGSSLANLRTTATPRDDGTYDIRGSKMWITGGEHDLGDNIIHFVLARLPDAPIGTRGISLFCVPKFVVGDDGSNGERNGVEMVGLNHKMGYRGSVNGILEFGESGPSIGHLVGIPHQGLKHMFHMMNELRVGTGLGAAATAYAGLRHSISYAKERPQGFKPGERDQSKPEVMIIEHADVRRMLLQQKAYVEGSTHLVLYCSMLMDRLTIAKTENPDAADELDLELALLTPIAKAWTTEYCIDSNRLAIQVLGGCGYTEDYPVERLYRDNRLNAIVEGTTGIQAMDLLGRKVTLRQGAAMKLLMTRMQETILKASDVEKLAPFAQKLATTCESVAATTMGVMGIAMTGEVEKFLANATPYLHLLGHTVIAWLWLQQGLVIEAGLAKSPDDSFLLGRRQAMTYFFNWELPRVKQWSAVLQPFDSTCLDMRSDWF